MKKFTISSDGIRTDFVFDNNHLSIQFSSGRGDPGSSSVSIPNVSVNDFLLALEGFRKTKKATLSTPEYDLQIFTTEMWGNFPTIKWVVVGNSVPSLFVEGWMCCSVDEFLQSVNEIIG